MNINRPAGKSDLELCLPADEREETYDGHAARWAVGTVATLIAASLISAVFSIAFSI